VPIVAGAVSLLTPRQRGDRLRHGTATKWEHRHLAGLLSPTGAALDKNVISPVLDNRETMCTRPSKQCFFSSTTITITKMRAFFEFASTRLKLKRKSRDENEIEINGILVLW